MKIDAKIENGNGKATNGKASVAKNASAPKTVKKPEAPKASTTKKAVEKSVATSAKPADKSAEKPNLSLVTNEDTDKGEKNVTPQTPEAKNVTDTTKADANVNADAGVANPEPNATGITDASNADNKRKPKTLKDTETKVHVPFERKTRLQKTRLTQTVKQLFKAWKKSEIRFDLAIQRNDVWTLEQSSLLIHSILYGFPVPPVYVQITPDGVKWFLDGKQRVGKSLMPFINGDHALSKHTPDIFGIKIAGCKFKDLPEDIQDFILDEPVELVKMENMTDEERDEMFKRLNGGTGLTRIELTRSIHSELIEKINQISAFSFFKEDIALSPKARNRFVDQEIILQIAMMMEEGLEKLKGFGANHVEEFVQRLKDSQQVLSDNLVNNFKATSDYLSVSVVDIEPVERKKALKKIHVPIIYHIAQKALEEKMDAKLFGQFLNSFFITTYSVESDYGIACQSGSSKKENVAMRLHEINRGYEMFSKIIKSTKNVEEAVAKFDTEWAKEIRGQVNTNQDEDEE